MSAPLMDSEVALALAQGRSVIVPTPQHAARLALAWARLRLAAGDAVWASPDILTWEAWLAREWSRSRNAGTQQARALRLLNRAQERRLWAEVLDTLDEGQGGAPLATHAGPLMRAAHRLTQSGLAPPRGAATAEERLLREARVAVLSRSGTTGLASLGLAEASQLADLEAAAPLVTGVARLTPLQQQLGEALWPGTPLLAQAGEDAEAQVVALRAPTPHEEIQAAARWCREQLREDPARRLLVIDAMRGRSIRGVAAEFWNALVAGTPAELAPLRDARLLAVQGGESLMQHALVAQALSALSLLQGALETAALGRLLRSPYFGWSDAGAVRIDAVLRESGRAQWTLQELAALPALAEPFARAADLLDAAAPRRTAAWAQAFDQALRALGFPGERAPDSRDAQRLMRWNELLDEFASLDVFGHELGFAQALGELEQLARLGAHESASGDAAITLTADRSDPLVRHDGIWVLGLTEECWPEPPRPDPFVTLALQRTARWPEASVELRQAQAEEELRAWRRRTAQLVLSHAAQADGVHQRPSRLLRDLSWRDTPAHPDADPVALEAGPADQLPAFHDPEPDTDRPLPGALRSLQLQQACAFRAQAEQRLAARQLETPVEGIDPRLRGQLLHAALEGLWSELRSQSVLAHLTDEQRAACIERYWRMAEQQVLKRWPAPPAPRALARERRRGAVILEAVLRAELEREAFEVMALERHQGVRLAGRRFELRIDRIDRLADGRRLVIDYKSGRAERMGLEEGPLQPLQLALYATALAAAGEPPAAVALQSLAAAEIRFTGVCDATGGASAGLRPLDDWPAQLQRWHRQLAALLEEFLQGRATVAPLPGACRGCPLPAFCRVGDVAVEPTDD